MYCQEILEALKFLSTPEKAVFLPKFFKTGKGEYGEGDIFLGVVVPDVRKIVQEYWQKLNLEEVQAILASKYHEMRLAALLICRSCGRSTACWWWVSATIGSGRRCMRKQKHLAMGSPTSLLPVPISVHTPSWVAAVWCCKTLASRTVHPLVTVFC